MNRFTDEINERPVNADKAKDGTNVKLTSMAVKPSEAIVPLDFGAVPIDVHTMAAVAQSDIEQDTGLGEVALGGDVGSDTATGVQAQQKSVGITLDLKRDAITNFLKKIIEDQLGVSAEQVTDTASFIDDLGADSLDTVELVMALEEEFDIEIPDEDAEKMTTVASAVGYLEQKVSS